MTANSRANGSAQGAGAKNPTETISAADYRALITSTPKSGNRGARGVWVGDEYFGSTIEAHHVINTLRPLERAGLIWNIKRQVPFELHAGSGDRIGKYVCDATFEDKTGLHVHDVKGHPIRDTELALWKIRHFEAEYDLKVEIVRLQVQRRKGGDRVVPIKTQAKRAISKKRRKPGNGL